MSLLVPLAFGAALGSAIAARHLPQSHSDSGVIAHGSGLYQLDAGRGSQLAAVSAAAGIPTGYGLSYAVAQLTGQPVGPVAEYDGYVFQFSPQGVKVMNAFARRTRTQLHEVVSRAVDQLLLVARTPVVTAAPAAAPPPDTHAQLG